MSGSSASEKAANRPLTLTESALCGSLAACLFFLQAEWRGYWHWWALVAASAFALTAACGALRHIIGEQRLHEWGSS